MIQPRALDKLRYAAADNAATPLAPLQAWALAIGAGAAFFLIAFASIELTRYSDRIAPFWPANAVILVLLFRFRALRVRRVLAFSTIGNVAANLAAGDQLMLALGLSIANMIEIAVAWSLTRRFGNHSIDLTDLRQLRQVVISCAVVAPLASALLAVLFLAPETPTGAASTGFRWWVTDGLGMLLIVPAGLMLNSENLREWASQHSLASKFQNFLVGIAVVSAIFLQQTMPLLFLVAPVIIMHASRDGMVGTIFATIKVALVATVFTSAGSGPMMLVDDPWTRLVVLQVFIVTLWITGVPLAAAIQMHQSSAAALAERTADLIEQTLRAERAALTKSRFLANMSHELRTPMNGVLGFAELMADEATDREQRRRAELIVESGESMMRLLNDVLDIARIESGSLSLSRDHINLEHLLSRAVSLHQAVAARASTQLGFSIDAALPPSIFADRQRLQQILLNLVGNAIKFTRNGTIDVRADRTGESIVFTVTDTGIGIPPHRLEAIFERFEQADMSATRSVGGSGLGLTISRDLAMRMGGTLTVTSTVGAGSTFVLELPLEPAPDRRRTLQFVRAPDCADLPAARILLAEDNPINQELMRDMLARLNQSVVIASDGHEAVEAVRRAAATGDLFDIVFMDMQMPNCDGYEAASRIRDLGYRPEDLPIVALTADAFAEDVERARQAGMQEHLTKPVNLSDLTRVLRRFVQPPTDTRPSAQSPARDIGAHDPTSRLNEFGKTTGLPRWGG